MVNEWVDPIFVEENGTGELCFDSCDRFGEGCRQCKRVKQAHYNAVKAYKSA